MSSTNDLRDFNLAFSSVASGLIGPSSAIDEVKTLVWSLRGEGVKQAGLKIATVWPSELTWPDADDYLKTLDKRVDRRLPKSRGGNPSTELRNIGELLFFCVTQSTFRIRRGRQILDLVNRNSGPIRYAKIKVTCNSYFGRPPCGRRDGQVKPAAQLIDVATSPSCGKLGCLCTFDPVSNA